MNKILIAASVLALTMRVAQAGEGNSEAYPNTAAHSVVANQVLSDTGSESTPTYGRGVTVLTPGDVLPTNGSEGAVQTANSLPSRFEEGTAAYAQAQSIHRWALAHQAVPARKFALRLSSPSR